MGSLFRRIFIAGILILVMLIGGVLFFFSDKEKHTPAITLLDTKTEQPQEIDSPISKEPITIASNLRIPWRYVALPSGAALVTERDGQLLYLDGKEKSTIDISEVLATGEGGLLGLTLHPAFETNSWIYIYATIAQGDQEKNQVLRYRFDEAEKKIDQKYVIVDDIPAAIYHNGGEIAFGPDGYLYITTGDARDPNDAQDINSLAGKILRVDEDGNIPTDNPFENAVWSYGHRNPQGLAWDAEGDLWSTEHGRSGALSGLDELNLIVRGGNYGWPIIEGNESAEGMISPLLHSGASTTWAPGSLAFVSNTLYFGGLRGESVYKVTINEQHEVTSFSAAYEKKYGRIRAALPHNSGLLLLTSNQDGRATPTAEDDRIIWIPRF